MHFLLATVLFLEIFVGYSGQVSGEVECEEGEEWDACRTPCETTCDDIKRGIRSNCSGSCISGCFCVKGLVRADDRTCVPPAECHFEHIECHENEEYLDCGSPCPLNCTNLNSPVFCTKPCHRGCFCKPNFVRNSRGRCVEPRKCGIDGNVQCPANEEYVNCVNLCNTCSASEYCRTPYCTPGCDCKPGYYRSTYGQCITAEQCIAEEYALQQQCGVNEVYTNCVNPCNDCYSRGRCDDYSLSYCSPGCDCKPGYFRNDNGVCVPEWNCLRERQPICPPGEDYYNCIPTCKVTCDTYNIADVICDTTCNRGCFCSRGFVRRADGLCVQPSECPARHQPCPQGEIFYQCMPTCGTTCRTLNSSTGLCSTECKQGCFCQRGFVRNDNGICVPPSECPQIIPLDANTVIHSIVCGPNEEFRSCGSACPASCENFRERRTCPQQRCLRGCFCKTGFVLGPSGICIRPRDCPVTMCRLNEEFRTCGSACPPSCENLSERNQTCSQQRCLRGCFCKTGFVLGPNGICIQPRNCPVLMCRPNEEFRNCGSACPPSCENLSERNQTCSQQGCLRGCFCKTGFVLGPRGICIQPHNCPVIMCRSNEEFRTCGSACPPSCENLSERNQTCSQQQCLRGCFCKRGFVLGPKGICIQPRNCPVQVVPLDANTVIHSNKPNPCCGGFRGRKGNETDDEDTTPVAITTKETPSNATSSATTIPSSTSEKVPDKTTTPKSGDVTTTPKSMAADTSPKPKADTTAAPTTTSAESKTETIKSTTNSAVNGAEAQTNNTELTTLTDLTNTTTSNSTEKP